MTKLSLICRLAADLTVFCFIGARRAGTVTYCILIAMSDAAIEKMNNKLRSVTTARFCPLQALESGNRLAVVKHTFDGKADPTPVLVQVDKNGKVITSLDGLSSAKEMGFRTPMMRTTRVFASLKQLTKQTDDGRAPTQMIEVTAANETSQRAIDIMNPLPAWEESVYANGFLMGKDNKGDPRKKTTEAKRKLKRAEFGEWFDEVIEGQGGPYASAWAKYKDQKTIAFRTKVLARVWDETESTESDYDKVVPRVADLHKTQMHRTKLEPIKVFYNNKLVQPEEYDDVISCVDLVYITGTMKLVHSTENKVLTLMTTPKEIVMANKGSPRGHSVAEAPVSFDFGSTAEVDVSAILAANEPPAKKAKVSP